MHKALMENALPAAPSLSYQWNFSPEVSAAVSDEERGNFLGRSQAILKSIWEIYRVAARVGLPVGDCQGLYD